MLANEYGRTLPLPLEEGMNTPQLLVIYLLSAESENNAVSLTVCTAESTAE